MAQGEREYLLAKARVEERPFSSATPLVGPLLARFRAAWNSVAAKWYVQPLLAQQNEYNRQVALRLLAQDGRLVSQDQQQTEQAQMIAELTAQVVVLKRRIEALEAEREGRKQSSVGSEQ